MNSLFKSAERCFWIVAFSAVILASGSSYAHDWPVHMAITASAFTNSAGLQIFISENMTDANALLSVVQPQVQGPLTVSNWLTMGSMMEDQQTYNVNLRSDLLRVHLDTTPIIGVFGSS